MITSTSQSNSRAVKALRKTAVILVWLLIWQIIAVAVNEEILIVSPVVTAKRLVELATQGEFWLLSLMTLIRIIKGYLIGIVVGTAVAVLTANIKIADEFLKPLLSVIRATPVASFIILALVWIRRDNVPLFATSLIVIPIIWANVTQGIYSADRGLLEMAKVFGFSKRKKLFKIYVPSVMPFFFAGCSTAIGLAWKSGVAAEVLSLPSLSIGKELYYSKIYIETADLFAWTVVVITLSMILEKLLKKVLSGIGGRQ